MGSHNYIFLHRTQFKKPLVIRTINASDFMDDNVELMYALNEELAQDIDMLLRKWNRKIIYLVPGSFGELVL